MLAPMKTECPHCHTLFRLTESQLDIAGGQVRCGYCYAVFNAQPAADFSSNDRQLDVFENIPAPTDEETDAEAIVPQRSGNMDRASSLDHAAAETVASPGENDTIEHFTQDVDAVVPGRYGTNASTRHSSWSTLLWSIAILFMIFSLVAQYTWFNRGQLQNQPQLQQYIAALCTYIRCDELISFHDPNSIEMLSRNVYTHPNAKDALMITATMISHASFSQALPDVQIDFSSTRGNVIASRRFKPAEYLQPDHDQLHQMQPDVPVTFYLEIVDPGKDAITYEFMFL
jgi:predicted Zn finger-like uncharacterized protein